MEGCQVRTDLALEARESVSGADEELRGVEVEEEYDKKQDIHITTVYIRTRNAAKAMGKAMGTYVTIEAPDMPMEDTGTHRRISRMLCAKLRELIPEAEKEQSILVVGLGNREVTADALGPHVVDNLFVTRHMVREYGKAAYEKPRVNSISCLEPGVTGKTGMEAAEIIKGVIDQTAPTAMLVVDALAARSTRRLNRTIQITDTGIHPGSGVGNHRNALTRENMGIPVIAIGVPTVVDAATIVEEAIKSRDYLKDGENYLELHNMYVTSKDIDAVIKRVSYTISEGINMALELV